jgi:ABC-2 type transport system ATP-binding protein
MQHAERLCDRILLIARGRKIFDGTLAQARRTIPPRVHLRSADDVSPLRQLGEVVSLRSMPPAGGNNGSNDWELELRENADPQLILQTCFQRGIRLECFNQTDPSLHEIFMRMVGTAM